MNKQQLDLLTIGTLRFLADMIEKKVVDCTLYNIREHEAPPPDFIYETDMESNFKRISSGIRTHSFEVKTLKGKKYKKNAEKLFDSLKKQQEGLKS